MIDKALIEEDTLIIIQDPDGWQYGVVLHVFDDFFIIQGYDGVRQKHNYYTKSVIVPTKGRKPIKVKRNRFGKVRWPK